MKKFLKDFGTLFFLLATLIVILIGMGYAGDKKSPATPRKMQQLETAEYVLGSPAFDTDRKDGYPFEIRGNLYAPLTIIECGSQPIPKRLGTYLMKVRVHRGTFYQATWVIRTGEQVAIQTGTARQIVWDGIGEYAIDFETGQQLTFTYQAVITSPANSGFAVIELIPGNLECFSARLRIIYLPKE